MRRLAPALLLAALLFPAGCVDHDHELVIENRGNVTVLVGIHKSYGPWWNPRRDDDELDSLPGFTCWIGRYTSQIEEIDVTVWRESDGGILYQHTFREGDFADFNNHIRIPIYP